MDRILKIAVFVLLTSASFLFYTLMSIELESEYLDKSIENSQQEIVLLVTHQ